MIGETVPSTSTCSLYLAPSSIPNAGLGVFTAKALEPGDSIPSLDSAIPIFDLEWNNAAVVDDREDHNDYHNDGDSDTGSVEDVGFSNPIIDYVWSAAPLGMAREGNEFEFITAFWPGVDAAVNSLPVLINLERALPEFNPDAYFFSSNDDDDNDNDNDDEIGRRRRIGRRQKQHQHLYQHRSQHPTAGSFSPYTGTVSYVRHPVPAGGELFKDYGDDWFLHRNIPVPVLSDIHHAIRFLQRFLWKIPLSFQKMVYEELLLDWSETTWKNKEDQKDTSIPRVLQLLPKTWTEFESHFSISEKRNVTSFQTFMTKSNVESGIRNVYQPNATRSLDWLRQHGTCLDHIEGRTSTLHEPNQHTNDDKEEKIAQMVGRGAFATRNFQQGDIITTSPLIHFPNQSMLGIFEIGVDSTSSSEKNSTKYIQKQRLGTQILVNYCLSHPETTLTLCPYGSGVNLINHHPHSDRVNVRLEWPNSTNNNSKVWLNHNATYLHLRPEDWKTTKPKLAVHYVATRPIQSGEELFLDYGLEWEDAWDRHVVAWKGSEWVHPRSLNGAMYVSATQWNRQHGFNDVLWTETELQTLTTSGMTAAGLASSLRPPPSIELRCHSGLAITKHRRYFQLRWDGNRTNSYDNPEYGRPCTVVRRSIVDGCNENATTTNTTSDTHCYVYRVRMETVVDPVEWHVEDVLFSNVPRHLLRWFDRPHSTDLHSPLAFRQPIGLPDSMVSSQWRNGKRNQMNNKNQDHMQHNDAQYSQLPSFHSIREPMITSTNTDDDGKEDNVYPNRNEQSPQEL